MSDAEQANLKCLADGHDRSESVFRTDDGERIFVATCRRCGRRLHSEVDD